jgi:predicted nuclease of restriction endonuclease-like (RecB) superfamily
MTQPDLDLKSQEPRKLLIEIRTLIEEARRQTAVAVNIGLTLLYWRIGRRIHHEVLGSERAAYGEQIVVTLSRQLVVDYGRGYSEKNLRRMVQFAEAFSEEEIVVTLSRQLSWSHFSALLPLSQPFQREFYAEMCRIEGWSVRTLRERIDSMLYERTALSKQPDALIRQELAILRSKGDVTPALVLKDPYVLDFLGLTDRFLEHDLEDAILRELEIFLLELGAGFSFVARRKTYPARRGRLLHRPAVLQPQTQALGGSGAEAGQLQARIQGADGALSPLAGAKRAGTRREPAARHHPLCRQKYRADRTVGTRCCRYPCGRVFDSSAPSRSIAGEAA